MSIRLTYSRLRGETIIQLIIDDDDLLAVPALTLKQPPNINISSQLIHLASIVDSIESTKQEEIDMLSQLTSPIDEAPDYDELPPDEEQEQEEPETIEDDPPFPDDDDFIPADDPEDDPLPDVEEE